MPHTKESVSFLIAENQRENRVQAWQSIATCNFIRAEKWATTDLAHSLGRFAKQRPDIVFIADQLHKESTLDAIRIMMKLDPQSFIVGMLRTPDVALRSAMVDAGAIGIIYKPFSQLTVHQVIASYLEYRKRLWSTDEKEIRNQLEPIQNTYRQVLTYLEREIISQHSELVR
ncbi:MAG: hypothetical protein U1E36_01375 [Rickettsiales bacterium]